MTSFLGTEVEQDKSSIRLHLDNRIHWQDTLSEYKAAIKKFVKQKQEPIMMQPGIVLEHYLCPETPYPREQKVYSSFVAKLQFAASWTRCDIAFTAPQLVRFCASAGASQWAALHHVMGYLEANPSFKLTYSRGVTSGLDNLKFADSDWENRVSSRSTTGLMTRFNETIVLWRSKMQKTVALSTAEAEYYAASEMAIKVIYLRNLLENMASPQAPDTPVYEDNTACIEWGNHVIGGRECAKHIALSKHFVHETIQNRMMRMTKIDTSKQIADIFTKPLAYAQFIVCVRGILGDPDTMRPTRCTRCRPDSDSPQGLATPEGGSRK
jgi:hypothetical protein